MILAVLSQPVLAVEIDVLTTPLTSIIDTILGVPGMLAVTLAIMWVGWKLIFGDKVMDRAVGIVIGVIIVWSAAKIAQILTGVGSGTIV